MGLSPHVSCHRDRVPVVYLDEIFPPPFFLSSLVVSPIHDRFFSRHNHREAFNGFFFFPAFPPQSSTGRLRMSFGIILRHYRHQISIQKKLRPRCAHFSRSGVAPVPLGRSSWAFRATSGVVSKGCLSSHVQLALFANCLS